MKKKKSSTLHRWMLLKNSPALDSCHQEGPFTTSTRPDRHTTVRAAKVRTPKMYTHDAT